ncbi:DUF2589 domain-containing protein [Pseudomonas putida]|uniref:DUF2589 domain-containing protein n=1 Tax=Pseudomonas putida TaxID=303 RepID=UPI0018A93FB0|nr:DUF2589 domain-containing protein [Pseudomonas putida]MBF8672197.1 DUF2589 domain-containing protein [Pseudomonas putida]MBF8715252.1 DUF2589 domain-containing protein [Pseudomonas putida]
MSIDNSLIGSVINALPMDRMIAGPLQAMVQAQVTASKSYADFLMQVCVQDGKAVAIQFDYDETIVDEQGEYKGVVSKTMKVPLVAAITHPNISIEEGNVEFELVINQMSEDVSSKDMNAEATGSLGWGPFRLNVKGSVSHKSTQTRKTDTRARSAFNTTLKRQEPPEAMMRVIEFLTDAATKPTVVKTATLDSQDKISQADTLKSPAADGTPAPGAGMP